MMSTRGNKDTKNKDINNTNSNNTPSKLNNTQQSDMLELKSDMKEIKSTIQQLASSLTSSHADLNQQITGAMNKINETLAALTTQVNNLQEKDKQRAQQIAEMESRINKLEQQTINQNIEIKFVPETETDPKATIKTIAESVGVVVADADVGKAYRIKRNKNIIIEFTSLSKKKEIMEKIKNHRIDSNTLYENTNKTNNNYIYINDELTPHNRRLLWMAKIKAREHKWKFVWIRDSHIYARRNENSKHIIINNSADIELIYE